MTPPLFHLASDPLDPPGLLRLLEDRSCGGFATFEGRVRGGDGPLRTLRLEYQAHALLCGRIGTEIVEKARSTHGLAAAFAVHRTGVLRPGETALWIGVAGFRRRGLFEACSWILEEIKRELPVWKKEVRADGSSVWTTDASAPTTQPTTQPTERRSPCDPTPS